MGRRRNSHSKTKIKVSFWGVRGSVVSHNSQNSKYGGHTACVAIHYNKQWFVLDAGTGIRNLGKILEKKKEPITILLSHLHWDHIFGLPFFKPLYQKKRKVVLAGPASRNESFKTTLGKIIHPPFFPIRPAVWKANIRWLTLKEGKSKFPPLFIESRRVLHHDGTFGFRFLFPSGQKVIYVTDQELSPSNKKFAKWIEGADLLIHDSQYDKKTCARKKGWGHSAFEVVLEMAMKAKVKRYVLFHHDPDASDSLLEKRLRHCQRYTKIKNASLKCFLAKEGATFSI